MPNKKKGDDSELSEVTEKRIDDLPKHAQHIFKKAHASAIKEYKDPEKRRGDSKQSAKVAAHKVAWAAVKKKYMKKGVKWLRKEQ